MTGRTSKLLALAACASLALMSAHAQAKCGPKRSKYTKPGAPVTITLHGPDLGTPVYYWHDRSTYTLLYFRPADLIAYFEGFPPQGDNGAIAAALLYNIKVDQPLEEATDLFRYTLIDHRFDAIMNAAISGLMKEGKVTLDQWIFRDEAKTQEQAANDPKTILMVSQLGENHEEAARWFCTQQGNVLFKIGYVIYD
jgi:hypothetical protein